MYGVLMVIVLFIVFPIPCLVVAGATALVLGLFVGLPATIYSVGQFFAQCIKGLSPKGGTTAGPRLKHY